MISGLKKLALKNRLLRALWMVGGLGLIFSLLTPESFLPPRQVYDLAPSRGEWSTGCFISPGVYPTTTGGVLPRGLPTVGSWQDGDAWNGDGATVWTKVSSPRMRVCVAGYPQQPGCRLWVEFRRADETVTRRDCAISNPHETWKPWDFRVPVGTVAMRIVGEDAASQRAGWLAFSAPIPFWPTNFGLAYSAAQALCALAFVCGAGLLLLAGFRNPPGESPPDSAAGALASFLFPLAWWRACHLPDWFLAIVDHPLAAPIKRFAPVGLALSLFFLVLGAKWATVDRFGSDIPNWDQWDAEGLELLAPWFEQDHFLEHLFTPHNEHRIVLTKLQNLAVTLLAGQWDSRLECMLNAGLHAALALAFWFAGRRWLEARWHAPLFVTLAALFGLPIACQNILGGFHSQQYWLLGLSFAAIVLLPFARPWTAKWFVGALTAALALLTMGSGFFAAAIVFAIVALRLLRRDVVLREAWPTLALALAVVAIGWWTRIEVDYHQPHKAQNAHDFLFTIVHSLQWPVPWDFASSAAVILWFPWLIVAWRAARPTGGTDPRRAQTIAAIGGWVLLQVLATAYARGAGGEYPASRYMDTLSFGMAANALALGWLLSRPAGDAAVASASPPAPARGVARLIRRGLVATLAVAWTGVLAWGLREITALALRGELPDAVRYLREAEAYTRAYLSTKDRADLLSDNIPYPGADSFIERLTRPSLGALLPVSVRLPLELTSAASAHRGFERNHARLLHLATEPRHGLSGATQPLASLPTWGSFGAAGAAATGEWRSAPLTAPLGGWLKFETAGQLGEPGVTLELHDARTGARVADVHPTRIPGDTWRAAYVRAPRQPFVVVARDDDPHRWFAFSSPVEMSTLSYWAWRTGKQGLVITASATAAAALLGLLSLSRRKN
ncbi:MAG: hypothetical protein HY736_27690 [Verrucomicrobia bacterium]|nr:hypothetical protein [Verrucomicrobiota bacterium]